MANVQMLLTHIEKARAQLEYANEQRDNFELIIGIQRALIELYRSLAEATKGLDNAKV